MASLSLLPTRRAATYLASSSWRAARVISVHVAGSSSGSSIPRHRNLTTFSNRKSAGPPVPVQSRSRSSSDIHSQFQPHRQLRCNSSQGISQFKQWGFEDITASLPQEPQSTASPTQKPNPSLILIDVREPSELKSTGIIPSAINIPLTSQPDALFLTPDEFETRFGFPKPGIAADDVSAQGTATGTNADADVPIVFYCRAGVRARTAAQLAVQAGYDPKRVGVYAGSWLDWEGKKGRVDRWEGGGSE